MSARPIIKKGKIFCQRCHRWIPSLKYLSTGQLPTQCCYCKRKDFLEPKLKRERKRDR